MAESQKLTANLVDLVEFKIYSCGTEKFGAKHNQVNAEAVLKSDFKRRASFSEIQTRPQ